MHYNVHYLYNALYINAFLWHQAVLYQLCVITVTIHSVCLQYPLRLSCFALWGILLSLWVKWHCSVMLHPQSQWAEAHTATVYRSADRMNSHHCVNASARLSNRSHFVEPDGSKATFYGYVLPYYYDSNSENSCCITVADFIGRHRLENLSLNFTAVRMSCCHPNSIPHSHSIEGDIITAVKSLWHIFIFCEFMERLQTLLPLFGSFNKLWSCFQG